MVGEFDLDEEMMRLSEMSKHSLICTVTRMGNTWMTEDEQMLDRRLGKGEKPDREED